MSAPLSGSPRPSASRNSLYAWSQNSSSRPSGLPACSYSSNARFPICSSVGWAMIEFSRAQVPPCAGDAKGRARTLLLVASEPIRGLGQSFLAFGDAGRSQPHLRPGRRLPKFLEAGNAGSRYQVCLLWSGYQASGAHSHGYSDRDERHRCHASLFVVRVTSIPRS